jgi:hypothetical protein
MRGVIESCQSQDEGGERNNDVQQATGSGMIPAAIVGLPLPLDEAAITARGM